MKRAATAQSGFTLIEMLLAMAVFAMVMAGVYAALRSGLQATRQRQAQILQTGRAALDALSSHAHAAFTVPGSGAYPLRGAESDISFFAFPGGKTQPVKIAYFLGDGKACKGLCRTVNGDPLNPDAPEPPPEPVAPEVSALRLSYFDGGQWLPSWSEPGALPRRIRISVAVTPPGLNAQTETFETEVNLPGAAWIAASAPPAE